MTRDTVLRDTPAASAMSRIVTTSPGSRGTPVRLPPTAWVPQRPQFDSSSRRPHPHDGPLLVAGPLWSRRSQTRMPRPVAPPTRSRARRGRHLGACRVWCSPAAPGARLAVGPLRGPSGSWRSVASRAEPGRLPDPRHGSGHGTEPRSRGSTSSDSTESPAGRSASSTAYTSGPRSRAIIPTDGVYSRVREGDPRRHLAGAARLGPLRPSLARR